MKRLITAALLSLCSVALMQSAYAGDYKQTIKLNILGEDHGATRVCFKTTDIFDHKRCGNHALNQYDQGPKNWYITFDGDDEALFEKEPACLEMIRKKQRTPEANGTLTIHAAVEYILPEHRNDRDVMYLLKNCKSIWVSE